MVGAVHLVLSAINPLEARQAGARALSTCHWSDDILIYAIVHLLLKCRRQDGQKIAQLSITSQILLLKDRGSGVSGVSPVA